MIFRASLSSRLLRSLIVALAGWLLLEFVLMQLIAARIGWGATLAFLSVKGGAGLLLVGVLTARGLRRLSRGELTRAGGSVGFGIASAVLITLPGIFPTLLGIALFAPSFRAALLKRFTPTPEGKAQGPREIDLEDSEWRELRARRLAKKTKPRGKPSQTDALEAKPPSV
jgi:UPF0716 family protein affecting phage T7 exclusion